MSLPGGLPQEDLIYIVLMAVACIVGLPINLHALGKLCRAARKHTCGRSGMIFYANVIFGNLLVLTVDSLGGMIWRITWFWEADGFLCKLFAFGRVLGNHVNSNLVVGIAIDMCMCLTYPLHPHRHAGRIILGCYALALLCSGPQLGLWTVARVDNYTQCLFVYYDYDVSNQTTGVDLRHAYSIYHLLTIFWIPFMVLAPCYVIILVQVFNYTSGRNLSGYTSARRHGSRTLRPGRGVLQAAGVISLYLISWLPYQTLSIILVCRPDYNFPYLRWLYTLRILNNILNVKIYYFSVIRRQPAETMLSTSLRTILMQEPGTPGLQSLSASARRTRRAYSEYNNNFASEHSNGVGLKTLTTRLEAREASEHLLEEIPDSRDDPVDL